MVIDQRFVFYPAVCVMVTPTTVFPSAINLMHLKILYYFEHYYLVISMFFFMYVPCSNSYLVITGQTRWEAMSATKTQTLGPSRAQTPLLALWGSPFDC